MAMNDQMAPAAPAPAPGPPPAGGMAGAAGMPAPGGEGGAPISEQEQNAYDGVVVEGTQRIDKQSRNIVKAMEAAPDKAQAVGELVANLVVKMDDEKQGAIPDTVVVPAAAEILEHAVDGLQEAGVPGVDDKFLQRATTEMVRDLMEGYGTDQAEVDEFLGGMAPEQLDQARREGDSWFAGQSPIPEEQAGAAPPAAGVAGAAGAM